jgi:formate hydrogenlyase transcriptional activator
MPSNSGTPTAWLSQLPGKIVNVHCKCPVELSASRFAHRKRHPGHLDHHRSHAEILASIRQVASLQEKSFERLGGTRTIPIDVRLVAATNRNLDQMMGDRLFRSDLYYRLKVFPITTPPLRDHPEDIPILARYFTSKYAAKMDRVIEKIPTETMKALVSWQWPGNVRELENFIERSVILSRGPSLRAPVGELIAAAVESANNSTLEEVEREHILRVFRETGGVVSAAATRLGIPRTTLNALMTKLGISRSDL